MTHSINPPARSDTTRLSLDDIRDRTLRDRIMTKVWWFLGGALFYALLVRFMESLNG